MADKIIGSIGELYPTEFSLLTYYPQKKMRCMHCGELCILGDDIHLSLHLYCQERGGIAFLAKCYDCRELSPPKCEAEVPVVSKDFPNPCRHCTKKEEIEHCRYICRVYLTSRPSKL